MPPPKTLTDNEFYALTAYILALRWGSTPPPFLNPPNLSHEC
jgi:hypothetical protein